MHPKYAMASFTRRHNPNSAPVVNTLQGMVALQRTGCGPMTDSNSNFSWLSLPGTAV
jgi:hypothetical protein